MAAGDRGLTGRAEELLRRITPSPAVRLAFSLLVLAVLLYAARSSMADIGDRLTVGLALGIAAAVTVNVGANLLLADAWWRVLSLMGHHAGRGAARAAWVRSQLARYAIGSAQLLSRPALAVGLGVPLARGLRSTVVETVWQTLITGGLGVALAAVWLDGALRVGAGAAAAVLLLAAVWLLRPARLLGASPPRECPAASSVDPLDPADPADPAIPEAPAAALPGPAVQRTVSVAYLVNALLRIAAFLAILSGLVGVPTAEDAIVAAAAFIIGNLAGLVVFLAPGGLGPREGVTAALLAPVLDSGADVIVLVAAARLAEVIAEGFTIAAVGRGPAASR